MKTQNNFELNNEKDESGVKVTKYRRALGANEIEFARVGRSTADIDSILTLIAKYDTGVNRLMVQYCLGLFKKAVIEKLKAGRAVNLLGLGVMYINAAFGEDGDTNLGVGFTPSAESVAAVQKLDTTLADAVANYPLITSIIDLYTQLDAGTLTAGHAVRILGKRLRLDDYKDDKAAVIFKPIGEDGSTSGDESKWITVSKDALNRNKPSELEFYLPTELAEGKYEVTIRTHFSGHATVSERRESALDGFVEIRRSE